MSVRKTAAHPAVFSFWSSRVPSYSREIYHSTSFSFSFSRVKASSGLCSFLAWIPQENTELYVSHRMDRQSIQIDRDQDIKNIHFSYPIKVWLTALFLIAPLCVLIRNSIENGNIHIAMRDLITVFFVGIAGSIFSLPVYGILFFAFHLLTRKKVSTAHVRWILDSICVLGIFITFKLLDENPELTLALCYSVSVIIASLLYRIYYPSSDN